jgi:hypothetical protein
MTMGSKMVGDVRVMDGTRAMDLLNSKEPTDQRVAKRLMEYCRKAESANYDYSTIQKLRNEFKDVV